MPELLKLEDLNNEVFIISDIRQWQGLVKPENVKKWQIKKTRTNTGIELLNYKIGTILNVDLTSSHLVECINHITMEKVNVLFVIIVDDNGQIKERLPVEFFTDEKDALLEAMEYNQK